MVRQRIVGGTYAQLSPTFRGILLIGKWESMSGNTRFVVRLAGRAAAALVLCGSLTAVGAIVASNAGASGEVLYVATPAQGGSDSGNTCTDEATPCATIGYALTQGVSGDSISVGAGTFDEAQLIPTYPVTIEGAGPTATIVDVTTVNSSCANDVPGIALMLNAYCEQPIVAGSYGLTGVTLEGLAGATSADSPIDVVIADLPAGSSVDFNNDAFVTNTTVDPNLSTDFSVGIDAYGSTPTESPTITVTDDTFTGFFQGVLFEALPGAATVSGNTFSSLLPSGIDPTYPAEGVFLLSDGAYMGVSMNGPYVVSGNTFTGYDGYGIAADAGYTGYPGSITDVSISGNTIDLPTDPTLAGGTPFGVGLLSNANDSDTLTDASITDNDVTTSGPGAIDVEVDSAAGDTTTPPTIVGNDLLGGSSALGVDNLTPDAIGAEGNWWGDPSGAGPAAAGSGTGVSAAVDSANWCTDAVCPSVESAPTIAAAEAAVGSATVSWQPATTDGGDPTSGYVVTASPGDQTETVGPSGTSATIPGLAAGQPSSFSVSAVNAAGTSPASNQSNEVIPKFAGAGTPSAVSASIPTSSIDSAAISWTAPLYNGSPITSYTVSANDQTTGISGSPVSVDAAATSADETGLNAGDSYTFSVTATDLDGPGAPGTSDPVVPIGVTPSATTSSGATVPSTGLATAPIVTTPSSSSSPVSVSIAASATGTPGADGTLTVSSFASNPIAGFAVGSAYFDISVSSASAFSSVSFQVCGIPAGEVVQWWDPITQTVQPVSDQTASSAPGSCATVTVNSASAPSLDQLYGTVLTVAPPNTPSAGYWEVAADGGVFSFGAASFYGSMGGQPLDKPIVGMAATSDNEGYWEVASDGGVFAFGDAIFVGSAVGLESVGNVVGMAAGPSSHGYWIVAADGGVFTFGDANFRGSIGGQSLNGPIVAFVGTSTAKGYDLAASDGGIFSYGDAVFEGSAGNIHLNAPIVGLAS
jgi:Fibronectin type III domain